MMKPFLANEYKTSFTFIPRKEVGDLATKVTITITDSNATKPYKYAIDFSAPNLFDLKNITLNTIIRSGYNYPTGGRDLVITGDGIRVSMRDTAGTAPEFRPEQGDRITINYAMNVLRNNQDYVIKDRPHQLKQIQTTTDGVSLQLVEPEIIKSVSRIGGTDNVEMDFEVLYPDSVKEKMYIISIEGNGKVDGNGFVLLSVTETSVQLDTLFTGETFYFDGIEGQITFPTNAPPSAGNKFSLETIKPVMPNIKDSYSFKIKGAQIDHQQITNELNKIRVVPNPYLVSSLL